MTETAPSELQRLLATEFDRHRWEYDLAIGQQLVAEIERSGQVEGQSLAQVVPAEFFHRNRVSRANVAAAIERAVGGRTPNRRFAVATLVFTDNRRYELKLEGGAHFTNSKLNLGSGTQINVERDASRDDVLAAVEAILRAGLADDWNDTAAHDLASLIESRGDVDVNDIREITAEIVEAEQPKRGRVKDLLGKVAIGGLGGALGTGLSAGLGELINQLPP